MRLPLLLILLLTALPAQAQSISGRVMESDFDRGLSGANVQAVSLEDTTRTGGTSTDREGFFRLEAGWKGATRIRISHLGFSAFVDTVDVEGDLDFGVVTLRPEVLSLEPVEVRARRERMVVKGDTVEFFAGGFFVPRYTYAESLVEALPGFEMRGGVVYYLGRPIDRVLVDGRAYYGADVMEALTTLPIEMIEALQVYEQLPESRQFSGVDFGEREQVINLVTDPNKRNALMWDLGAGGGTSDRYSLSTGVNHLNAPLQVRGELSSENVNHPSSGGISRTHRGTASFANTWNENTQVRLTYAANDGVNRATTEVERTYIGGDVPGSYDESRLSDSDTRSHTLSGSVRHQFGERFRISSTPRLLVMRSDAQTSLDGMSLDPLSGLLRSVSTATGANSRSVTGGVTTDLSYSKERFGVHGYTNVSFSDDLSESFQTSSFDPASSFLDATETDSDNGSIQLEGNIGVTARIRETAYWSTGISYGRSNRAEDRRALSAFAGEEAVLDSTLSSDFDSESTSAGVITHLGWSKAGRDVSLSLSANQSSRTWTQDFPEVVTTTENDMLLSMDLNGGHQLGEWGRVRASYSLSSSAPDGTEIQRLVDNSNPLFLSVGNPDLKATTSHRFSVRANLRRPESPYYGNLNLDYRHNRDEVGTETWYAGTEDRLVLGILIPAGGQLTREANIGHLRQMDVNGSASRSFQGFLAGASTSLSLGLSRTHRPESVNGTVSDALVESVRAAFQANAKLSPRSGLNAHYSIRQSRVQSEIRQSGSADYITHSANLSIQLVLSPGLSVNSGLSVEIYERLASDFDTRSAPWSVSANWRPRFAEQLYVSMSVNDILNSAATVQRSENGLYLESRRANRLGRHATFTIGWQVRTFRPGR